MDRRLIIIHKSEIVRKGLWAILRETFQNEFILLKNVNELSDYSGFTNTELYLFIQDELFDILAKKVINKSLDSSNRLFFIPIVPDSTKKDADNIYINDEASNIIPKIKKLVESTHENVSLLSELSAREKDVLIQVAMGLSNKEIADKLFISIHTVITHRKHITDKLGIKSISGLTVYAILNKLIDTDNIDPASLI